MNRLKAITSLLFGRYVVIKNDGVNILIESNMNDEAIKETACKFFRLAYMTT